MKWIMADKILQMPEDIIAYYGWQNSTAVSSHYLLLIMADKILLLIQNIITYYGW